MEVDPSALFTVLFLSPDVFTDYQTSDLKTLNYTFLGDVNQYQLSGMWTDVEISLTNDENSDHPYEADVTIFIALGTPPDAGLSGTLSICVTPNTTNWKTVSLMAQLEEKYGWPTIYISYYFYELNGYYEGYVEFA